MTLPPVPTNLDRLFVGPYGTVPAEGAVFEANSTEGGLLTPRMTQAQRLAILTPTIGTLVYQTDVVGPDTAGFYYLESTGPDVWAKLEAGAGGGFPGPGIIRTDSGGIPTALSDLSTTGGGLYIGINTALTHVGDNAVVIGDRAAQFNEDFQDSVIMGVQAGTTETVAGRIENSSNSVAIGRYAMYDGNDNTGVEIRDSVFIGAGANITHAPNLMVVNRVAIGTDAIVNTDATMVLGAGLDVVIGASSNTPTAILSLTSTTKGFLMPVMTTIERNAIAAPAVGLQVYDTVVDCPFYFGFDDLWHASGAGGLPRPGIIQTGITGDPTAAGISIKAHGVTPLVAGTVTIPLATVQGDDLIFLTRLGPPIGAEVSAGPIAPGVEFEIHSSNGGDTGDIQWIVYKTSF